MARIQTGCPNTGNSRTLSELRYNPSKKWQKSDDFFAAAIVRKQLSSCHKGNTDRLGYSERGRRLPLCYPRSLLARSPRRHVVPTAIDRSTVLKVALTKHCALVECCKTVHKTDPQCHSEKTTFPTDCKLCRRAGHVSKGRGPTSRSFARLLSGRFENSTFTPLETTVRFLRPDMGCSFELGKMTGDENYDGTDAPPRFVSAACSGYLDFRGRQR
jgi:hypothetical protein